MKYRVCLIVGVMMMFLTACGTGFMEHGPGGGMGGGMMARHHATIPDEYAGVSNPISADEASLARGEEIYTANCASCHGDGGVGDGPAAEALDPGPTNIAHTGQMLGDDYLLWRISEGGAESPFNSAMPSWKATLDEEARWDAINYIRALGSGEVTPEHRMGGATFDPAAENEQRSEMLAQAVSQGVITQEEADIFNEVHGAMDFLRANQKSTSGTMEEREASMVAELVTAGTITQEQADIFGEVHDKLLEAGLMQ
ncbi:MAG: c-type cytochrome [Ardenticatenaceae bacterium]